MPPMFPGFLSACWHTFTKLLILLGTGSRNKQFRDLCCAAVVVCHHYNVTIATTFCTWTHCWNGCFLQVLNYATMRQVYANAALAAASFLKDEGNLAFFFCSLETGAMQECQVILSDTDLKIQSFCNNSARTKQQWAQNLFFVCI